MEYGIDQTIKKLRNSTHSVHLVCIVCIEVGHNVAGVNGVDVEVVVVIVIVVDVVVNIENKGEHLNILSRFNMFCISWLPFKGDDNKNALLSHFC